MTIYGLIDRDDCNGYEIVHAIFVAIPLIPQLRCPMGFYAIGDTSQPRPITWQEMREISEVKKQELVLESLDSRWHSAIQPLTLWEWISPEEMFNYSVEKTDITCLLPGMASASFYSRSKMLEAIPLWALELCLKHWPCRPRLFGVPDYSGEKKVKKGLEHSSLFLPHIEAYIAEKKGAKP